MSGTTDRALKGVRFSSPRWSIFSARYPRLELYSRGSTEIVL
ncbi:MAG: hypothetical protein AVDCRST_MAG37-3490 [uncultured Rubrobacteraceae bacterium]|uniref:Uncharacterized protein n=1 Tax=uncultured Rubrobacteraceae bacterium TaxID=349277 RepID=A0A6J4QZ03_9ACTN|nr:MAG: hypothetical protein AVDCRST_MAG37-3490 [uncultured Rubrobacteraceae bacterium]